MNIIPNLYCCDGMTTYRVTGVSPDRIECVTPADDTTEAYETWTFTELEFNDAMLAVAATLEDLRARVAVIRDRVKEWSV